MTAFQTPDKIPPQSQPQHSKFPARVSNIVPMQSSSYNPMRVIEEFVWLNYHDPDWNEGSCCGSLVVHWSPFEFMREQYGTRSVTLGQVLTISGSQLQAQATTCEDYMRCTWPSSGLRNLELIQRAFSIPSHRSQGENALAISFSPSTIDWLTHSQNDLMTR